MATPTSSSSSSPPTAALQWRLHQAFGDNVPQEYEHDDGDADIISALQFDKTGNHLAVGDRGGRVVIFEKDAGTNDSASTSRTELERVDRVVSRTPKYHYKAEFQSHKPEFDYANSDEIEENIVKVKWCASSNGALFTLSTNTKTIKLWKVKDRQVKQAKRTNISPPVPSDNSLLSEKSFADSESSNVTDAHSLQLTENTEDINTASLQEDAVIAKCRRVFAKAHTFKINSLSVNSDWETFLSGDDLRINLWNLEVNDQCFNIIDKKPADVRDLREVITAAEFHPFHCNLLAYGCTTALVRLVDMRQSAICDHGARIFKDEESRLPRTLLTEFVGSISDLKFASDGRHILTRDYMTLKLWDTHMEARPVATYRVHESLRPRLQDLYNNDAILDKFGCCIAGDRLAFATGSYSNLVRIFSTDSGSEGVTFEASRFSTRRPDVHPPTRSQRLSLSNLARGFSRLGYEDQDAGSSEFRYDFRSKLLHLAWHPTATVIACAAGNRFFLFRA